MMLGAGFGEMRWLSIFPGLFALIISVLTFYTTTLRIDNVRLVVDGTVEISGNRESVNATPNSLQMTLINAGNRLAAITWIRLVVEQLSPQGCPNKSGVAFAIEPFSLKEGEVKIIQQMRIPGDSLAYKPCKPLGPNDTLTVRASAVFDVITPRGAIYVVSTPLNTVSIGPHSFSRTFNIVIGENEARTLYRHRDFSWWLPW